MAIKKISEFAEITTISDDDLFLIESAGEAKYIKASDLKTYFASSSGGDTPTGNYVTDSKVYFTSENMALDSTEGVRKMKLEGFFNWLETQNTASTQIAGTVVFDGNIQDPFYLYLKPTDMYNLAFGNSEEDLGLILMVSNEDIVIEYSNEKQIDNYEITLTV